jgi:acyl carrier protein phosphodiesterase
MKHVLREFVQYQMSQVAARTRGMGFLLQQFNPYDTGERDNEAMHGVGDVLEGLAEDMARLANLLEAAQRLDADFEVDVSLKFPDPIGQVERQVGAWSDARKGAA